MYTYLKPTKILYYVFEKIKTVSVFSASKSLNSGVNRRLIKLNPNYNDNLTNIKKNDKYIRSMMEEEEFIPEKFKILHEENMLYARQNIKTLDLLEKSGEVDEYTRIIFEDELSRACNNPLEFCDKKNVSGNNEMHNTITGCLKKSYNSFSHLVAYKKAKLNTQIHDSSCVKYDMSLRVGNTRTNHSASESENYDNEIKANHAQVTCNGKDLIKTSKDGVWYREDYLLYKTGRPDLVNRIFKEIEKINPNWIRMNSKYERKVFIINQNVTPELEKGKTFVSPFVFNTTVDKNDAYNLKAAPALGTISDNYINGNIEKDLVIGIANGDLPKDYKLLSIIKLFHEVMNEYK